MPADWDAHFAEEEKYLVAEEDRLLYVAATRAREELVVGRSTKKNVGWFGLQAFLSNAQELSIPVSVNAPPPAEVTLSASAASKAAVSFEQRHTRARAASWSSTSVTETVRRAGASAPPTDLTDPTSTLTASTSSRRADAGVEWGTLVHGLLEHAMRFPQSSRDDLRRMALWLTMDMPDQRAVIEQALDTVSVVATADFWTAARASSETHEEAPFGVRETAEGLPQVLNGAIDLVYRTSDGWQIVDYKTDVAGGSADLAAKYAGQMRAYEGAWSKVTGAKALATLVATRG